MMLFAHSRKQEQPMRGQAWMRAPFVISTAHGGETVLLDVRRGQYHTLNPVGGRVWELLAQGGTVDDIAQTIRGEYELPSTDVQVERDIANLLGQLNALGLLIAGPQPTERL